MGLLAAPFAFLLACPGAVLDSPKFGQDLQAEADHVRFHPEAEFVNTGSGFVYHITRNLDAGLGLPLLLLCLAAIGYALYRREQGDGLLAAFALPYYVLISLAAVRYARYIIPLLPVLALWAGRLLADVSRLPHPVLRRVGSVFGAIILLLTLANTFLLLHPMDGPDNRDVALARINQQASGPIGFAVQPWFYSPPVSPWFCAPLPGKWRQETPPETKARILYVRDWDVQTLQSVRPPPLVVLSEYDYDDALRQHDPATEAYLQVLRRDYAPRYVIAGRSALEDSYKTVEGLPMRGLPSDMLYTNPSSQSILEMTQ